MRYTKLGTHRPGRLAHLPGLHELRRPRARHPPLDARRGREPRRSSSSALELGINFFDTANVYSDGTSEEIVGRALRDFADRDEVVIATKVHGRCARARTAAACRARRSSPRSTPACGASAPTTSTSTRSTAGTTDTPIEETLEALHDVVKAGKARYIGASSMYAWQFAQALYTADRNGWTRFVSMQNHYNLLYREEEREMLPLCADQGIGVIPWSPLARGRLTRRLGRRRPRAPRPTSSARRSMTPRGRVGPHDRRRASPRSPSARGVAAPRSRWPGCCASPRHRADRRRHQARAPRRRRRRGRPRAGRRRGGAAGGVYVTRPVSGHH